MELWSYGFTWKQSSNMLPDSRQAIRKPITECIFLLKKEEPTVFSSLSDEQTDIFVKETIEQQVTASGNVRKIFPFD